MCKSALNLCDTMHAIKKIFFFQMDVRHNATKVFFFEICPFYLSVIRCKMKPVVYFRNLFNVQSMCGTMQPKIC